AQLKEKRVKERQDAIRQGTIPDPDKPRRLEDAISFVGTCMDMSPEFERHEREYQTNVEKFEKIPGTESIDHARAVKAYARPAAGAEQPLPSDVRPPKVLLSTLDYLINHIVGEGDLAESHAFVRDRTRSIRQDFTLQNSRGMEAIEAHEIIARYHILCMHQLCENKNFSDQQEMEQLRKVLTSLQEFYEDMRAEGVPCPNEAEFRAYHILSHLRDPDMIRQAQQLPFHIFQNPYIQVAAEIHALTRRNNDVERRAKVQSEASPNFFSRFFKLVAGPSTTYLMACLLETNFVEIRKGALKTLNKCYLDRHNGFPVEDLVTILGFDGAEECIANCEEYDLPLSTPDLSSVIFGRKDASRRYIFKGMSLSRLILSI
ncbi:MAG: SAC3/GANP/Nin1/mts3/eIF-3 p25 family-domain-containing protein, partial [Linnemannia gamsii]